MVPPRLTMLSPEIEIDSAACLTVIVFDEVKVSSPSDASTLISTVPTETPVTLPSSSTVAISLLSELQVKVIPDIFSGSVTADSSRLFPVYTVSVSDVMLTPCNSLGKIVIVKVSSLPHLLFSKVTVTTVDAVTSSAVISTLRVLDPQ